MRVEKRLEPNVKKYGILNQYTAFGIINNLLLERSEDRKIYSSRKVIFPSDVALRKYDIPWENKSSYLPHNHAINA